MASRLAAPVLAQGRCTGVAPLLKSQSIAKCGLVVAAGDRAYPGGAPSVSGGTDHGRDLRRQSASGANHTAMRAPFLDPAALRKVSPGGAETQHTQDAGHDGSSVRGTPRGLFGNKGSLTLGSTPVGPWRLIDKLPQFESLPE